ncbi:MAG: spermine synthase [Zetaproteobacteria bacterium]|nr:MAG: spermine synthase [Zetaproteobacteria bacterium]
MGDLRRMALLLLILAGTGVTALAYEVLWTRMLSLLFGVSIFGVVFTVAAFMAGLGLGGMLGAQRFAFLSSSRAMRVLAVIEGLLAVYALLLPFLLPALDALLAQWGGGMALPAWQTLQGAMALLLLFLPAFAMGLAFPAALAAADGLPHAVAWVYGVNALGGALGALLPLWLLPAFGWRQAVACVAGLGGMLACSLLLRARHAADLGMRAGMKPVRPAALDLLAYAGVGAAALMLEVLWTRLFGTVLLRTEYVLAVLLCVYLLGIALGSLLSRWMRARAWLSLLPVLAGLSGLLGLYALPYVAQAAAGDFSSLGGALLAQGAMVILCTLPVTLLLGAWLPLLSRRVGDGQCAVGGWWYGANSLGGAVGALVGGFVLLPLLGSAGALIAALALLLVSGMRWADRRWGGLGLAVLALLAWPVHRLPSVAELLPAMQDARDLFVYEDVVALTHVVARADGQRVLLSDLQRMDASSEPTAVIVQKNQARLPLLLCPDARSILFLGIGTGITAAGALPFGDMQRVGVELSRGAMIAAERFFAPVNDGVVRRLRLIHDDARRFLRASRAHFDVILGDLFHPDMAGRSNLLSVEQFARARARLSARGVFVQWLALNQFDPHTLQVVLHSFRQVFGAHAWVFVDGYRLAMVGFRDAPPDMSAVLRRAATLPPSALGGEGVWTWLARFWGTIPDFPSTPVQSEWAPVIEYALPRLRYDVGLSPLAMWRWLWRWRQDDARALATLGIPARDARLFQAARAAAGLDVRSWMAELLGRTRTAMMFAQRARTLNARDRWPAIALADAMYASLEHGLPKGLSRRQALRKVLAIYPQHAESLRALLRLAERRGDRKAAARWRERLRQVSPLALVSGGS